MAKIAITGGSSGLGLAIAKKLKVCDNSVTVLDLKKSRELKQIGFVRCDVTNCDEVNAAAHSIGEIDIFINNAGVNYIDWIENTIDSMWDVVMNTNAKSILLTTKAFLPALLRSKGTIINIISNASHMPMTNSIAYNASKGAAHIMTLQMARELGPKGINVFGISPNRLAGTGMSDYIDSRVCELRDWTKEYAREYQLKNLPAGEETDPETLAEFIAFLLSSKQRHKYLNGTILPYGK